MTVKVNNPSRIEDAMTAIASEFAWSATPQGVEYWMTVQKNLKGLITQQNEPIPTSCPHCGEPLRIELSRG